MSCYVLTPLDPNRFTCRVGWDSSVNSFYVYIARPVRIVADSPRNTEVNGQLIKQKGTEECELPTIESLELEIKDYAELPERIRELLLAEQREVLILQ